MSKTEEIVVDFSRKKTPISPMIIDGSEVEQVLVQIHPWYPRLQRLVLVDARRALRREGTASVVLPATSARLWSRPPGTRQILSYRD